MKANSAPRWCISAKVRRTRGKRRYVGTVMGIALTRHVGYNLFDGEVYLRLFCRFDGNGANGFICICHICLARRTKKRLTMLGFTRGWLSLKT